MNLFKKYLFLACLVIGMSSVAMEQENKRKLEDIQDLPVAKKKNLIKNM